MYQKHPYRWPVIGLEPEHIENARIADVQHFYKNWYTPNNAVLSIAGNVQQQQAMEWAEKWFGAIAQGSPIIRNLPVEPKQTQEYRLDLEADVPVRAIYLCFRTAARLDLDFYKIDLLSDILAQGHSSRLYRRLVKDKPLFSQIDAYVTANWDPGLLVIEGRPSNGVNTEEAIAAIWAELDLLKKELIGDRELEKIKNTFESTVVFSEINVLNKAQNLGYYELLDRAELIIEEVKTYLDITAPELQTTANQFFVPENSATLVYNPKSNLAEKPAP
jgi:predicted Zn-dependent peptidase